MLSGTFFFRSMKQYLFPAAALFISITAALILLCGLVSQNTLIGNRLELWIEACTWMDFFLPLALCVAFVPYIFAQSRHGFIRYASIRCGRRTYLITQFANLTVLTIAVTWTAYYLPLVISLNLIQPAHLSVNRDLLRYVFGHAEFFHPYVFGAVWCLWKGAVAALFVLFSSLLALYAGNLFAAVLAPFLYCMVENLVTALLKIPNYSIITSYVLNRLAPSSMHVWHYLVGVLSFLIIASIIILIVKRTDRNVK